MKRTRITALLANLALLAVGPDRSYALDRAATASGPGAKISLAEREPGFALRPDFIAGVRLLAKHGLSFGMMLAPPNPSLFPCQKTTTKTNLSSGAAS